MDEAAFRELISGRKRGILAAVSRPLLYGFSLLYGAGVRARNCAFELGIKKTHTASVPVISVGNITTGGTGKTPFVAYLTAWFRDRGVRVAIVSRGYRSLPGDFNDEKLLLDQLCPDVPHVQNPDRVAAVRVACDEHRAQLLVLDDGFQHRRLARDLDIVLIDALNPFGYGHLLPRGLLREPLSGLQRADLVVITRTDLCSDEDKRQIVECIRRCRGSEEHASVAFRPVRLVNSDGETAGFDTLAGQRVAAFCGIGNPEGFARTISDFGFRISDSAIDRFSDHHHYTPSEVTAIGERAKQNDATAILTTQKDLVKISRKELGGIPLWAVEIGVNIVTGAELLGDFLDHVAGSVTRP